MTRRKNFYPLVFPIIWLFLQYPEAKTSTRPKPDIFRVRDQHPRYKATISTFITCDEKWTAFESIICAGMDTLLPVKTIKKYPNEPPWMIQELKSLIQQRQKALANEQIQLFKRLRNRISRERKHCWSKYFDTKVSQLKVSDPKQRWKSIKSLYGMDPFSRRNDL